MDDAQQRRFREAVAGLGAAAPLIARGVADMRAAAEMIGRAAMTDPEIRRAVSAGPWPDRRPPVS